MNPLIIEDDAAELFHENSKITPFDLGADIERLPPVEPGVVLARVPLPKVTPVRAVELEEAIERRETHRAFDPRVNLSTELLARLLAFGCGFTRGMHVAGLPHLQFHRAQPSAGATYPLEVYPVVQRVQGVEPGVYHYALNDHSLEQIRHGHFYDELTHWTMWQPYVADTCVVFVIAGFSDRIRPRYKERGYRYMLFEAGHIAQSWYLLSTAYRLGALAVGGFVDAGINRLLGLDEVTQNALYIVAVGVPRALS